MSERADLDALFPTPEAVAVRGETVEVWPLRVRQLPKFSAAVAPVLEGLRHTANPAGYWSPERLDLLDWTRLLRDHGSDVIAAVAVAAEREPDWVADLFADDLLRLAVACVRVNADFFASAVVPALTEAMAGLPAGIGPTPSPNSSEPDSPTPAV